MADARVGRPRRSSRETIEDAAAELFLEQGYDKTTVEQIAQRAGVSRNTFFNYFPAKSDVLWVDLDESISGLEAELSETPPSDDPLTTVARALLDVASGHPSDRVPWALTQAELMRTESELQASGLARIIRAAAVIETYLGACAWSHRLEARVIAFALLGASAAACGSWADAGVSRRPLADYLAPAIEPVCRGFAAEGP
ncbi:hypothetical protein GCM10027416_14980 [Okibacterium endophyticum]